MRPEGPQDAWIASLRQPVDRNHDWFRPHSALVEDEPDSRLQSRRSLVVFLVNRECPWKCLECDLWKFTTLETVPAGAIPRQIEVALTEATSGAGLSQIKLYNSGSFFDPRAIPPGDDQAISKLLEPFDRVIVESHPALVGERCWRLRDTLRPRLEVAMGLETVHPDILPRLNKRMTLEDYSRAASALKDHDVDVRAFLLIRPPFLAEDEVVDWTRRGVEFAFEKGASVVSLIPTRFGNGALEKLASQGQFEPPSLDNIENAFEAALAGAGGRVFLDLWDLEKFSKCPLCFGARLHRLREMNRLQTQLPTILCHRCDEHALAP